MSETSPNTKNIARVAGENTQIPAGTQPITPAPNIPPAQQKLANVLGDILMKTQEVGLELATLECSKRAKCPLVSKTRELIMILKKLFEIRKEIEQSQQKE